MDDRTLLERYALGRDEAAFAELVRRHLPFVYSAALRRLGHDTHRANDVAQVVFCSLAREAHRVARNPVLAGWLFTTTRNAVINVLRGEKRRRLREEEAGHMLESEPSPDWSRLRPVLDSALDGLNVADREAVLLRFFQDRSFAEMGAVLGLSEDAARKRVERALTRLRDLLRPHGVASTSTALAAVLAGVPAAAAPAGLMASVTSAALSTGAAATLGAASFISLSKLQVAIGAMVILAAATGLLVQQRTIAELRATSRRQAQVADSTGQNHVPRATGTAAENAKAGATSGVAAGLAAPTAPGEVLADTAAALAHGKVPERFYAFAAVLQKLSAENWREGLQAFVDERKRTGLGHPEVYELFVRRAGEVAGKEAVNYFLGGGGRAEADEAMIGWASKNPTAALQWLSRETDDATRRAVMGAAIRGLALVEPDLAVRTLEEQPLRDRNRFATELVTSMTRSVGIDGVQPLLDGMISRAAETGGLGAEYLKHLFYDFASLRIYQATANRTLPEALDWLNRHVGQPYFDHDVIGEVTRRFAAENPVEAFRWLESVNATLLRSGDDSTAGYRALLDAWRRKEGTAAVETWLEGQASHPQYDHLASQYAALLVDQNPAKALSWANTIKDARRRQAAVQSINDRTSRRKS